jgi:TfoX/Sxy family transcriptional regulator of competence genes
MAYDEPLATRVRAFFTRRGTGFEEKRMMGGLCFMVGGKMCVGVEKERLMARIDPDEYESALRRKGCGPMDFTGRPMRGFVFVTGEGLRSERELTRWLKLALEFNPRANSSKAKRASQQSSQKNSGKAVLKRAARSS